MKDAWIFCIFHQLKSTAHVGFFRYGKKSRDILGTDKFRIWDFFGYKICEPLLTPPP